MPKLQDFRCRVCDKEFEFLLMPDEVVSCSCGSTDCEPLVGGRTFVTIVPDYPGAKRRKAGYVHNYVNRPAEKVSVSVPGRRGDS